MVASAVRGVGVRRRLPLRDAECRCAMPSAVGGLGHAKRACFLVHVPSTAAFSRLFALEPHSFSPLSELFRSFSKGVASPSLVPSANLSLVPVPPVPPLFHVPTPLFPLPPRLWFTCDPLRLR